MRPRGAGAFLSYSTIHANDTISSSDDNNDNNVNDTNDNDYY